MQALQAVKVIIADYILMCFPTFFFQKIKFRQTDSFTTHAGEVEKDVQEELIAEKLESSEDEKDQEQIHETKVDENIPLEEPRMVICTETLPLEEPPRMEICTREMFEDPAKEEPHIESCPREMFEDPTEDDISMNRTYETQETRIITDDQEIESR